MFQALEEGERSRYRLTGALLAIFPDMSFQTYGLITTHALHSAYLLASQKELRESSTVPFWEDIINKAYKEDDDLVVNSQQPVDDTTKSVDVVVRSYNQAFQPIMHLLLECKRHDRTKRGREEMEIQLFSYAQFFFDTGGLAQGRDSIYGAVASGTKLRGFEMTRERSYVTPFGMMGGSGKVGDKDSYRDPGIHGEAEQIRSFLARVRDSSAAYRPTAVRTIAGASTSSYTYAPSGRYGGASGGMGSASMGVGGYGGAGGGTGGASIGVSGYGGSSGGMGGASMGVGGYGGSSGGMGVASEGAGGRYEGNSGNMGEDSGSYGDASRGVEGAGGGIGSDFPSSGYAEPGSSDSTSIILVDVTKKKRGMNPTEYSFIDAEGTKVSTTASQWKARNGQFTHKRNNRTYMSNKPLA